MSANSSLRRSESGSGAGSPSDTAVSKSDAASLFNSTRSTASTDGDADDGSVDMDYSTIKKRIAKRKKEERLSLKSERRQRRQNDGDDDDTGGGGKKKGKGKGSRSLSNAAKQRSALSESARTAHENAANSESDDDDADHFTEGDEELSKHFKLQKMLLVGKIGEQQRLLRADASTSAKDRVMAQAKLAELEKELAALDRSIQKIEEKRQTTLVSVAEAQRRDEEARRSAQRNSAQLASSMTATMIKKMKADMMSVVGKLGNAQAALKRASNDADRKRAQQEVNEHQTDLKRLEASIKALSAQSSVAMGGGRSRSSSVSSLGTSVTTAAGTTGTDRGGGGGGNRNGAIDYDDDEDALPQSARGVSATDALLRIYEQAEGKAISDRKFWTLRAHREQSCAELCDKLCDVRSVPIGTFELHLMRPDGGDARRLRNSDQPCVLREAWSAINEFVFVAIPRSHAHRVKGVARSAQASPRGAPPDVSDDEELSDGAPPPLPPLPPGEVALDELERRCTQAERDDSRRSLFDTLRDSEQLYVDELRALVKGYAGAAQHKKFLDDAQCKALFRNVTKLWSAHQDLLARLDVAHDDNDDSCSGATLAKALQAAAETYYVYVAGAHNALLMLATQRRCNAALLKHEVRLQSGGKRAHQECLLSLLRRPLDRLFEYADLARRLQAVTDSSHADAKMVARTAKVCAKLCSFVTPPDRHFPLLWCAHHVDGAPDELDLAALSSAATEVRDGKAPTCARRVLSESQARVLYDGAERTFHFFLLTDMLLLSSPVSSDGRYKYRGHVYLDVNADFNVCDDAADSFELCHPRDWPVAMRVTLRCASECERWLQTMRRQVANNVRLVRGAGASVQLGARLDAMAAAGANLTEVLETERGKAKAAKAKCESMLGGRDALSAAVDAHHEYLEASLSVFLLQRRAE